MRGNPGRGKLMTASPLLAPATEYSRCDDAAREPVPVVHPDAVAHLTAPLTVSGRLSAITRGGGTHQEATPGCTSNAERPMTFRTKHRLDRAGDGAKFP